MWLDNIVILGTAVPSLLRDGRKSICVAAWQPELGLIRLYPASVRMKLSRWDIITANVCKSNEDSRKESYKFIGSENWIELDKIAIRKTSKVKNLQDKVDILDSSSSLCVETVNRQRGSLAIIKKPDISEAYIRNQGAKNRGESLLERIYEDWLSVKAQFKFEPALKYRCGPMCEVSGKHNQQILEHGAYEWFRKYPDKIDQVFLNWRINDKDYDIYLLTGNLSHQRSTFIVINIIPIKVRNRKTS